MSYTVRPISDRTMFKGRHEHSRFDTPFGKTEQLMLRELAHLSARAVVLELDFREGQLRLDGRPKANAIAASPAAALRFETKNGPMVFATDKFWTWQENVRGIALGLEALRLVRRYGIAESDQQYTGWKALPGGRAMPPSHMTSDQARQVLVDVLGAFDGSAARGDTRGQVRRAKGLTHPDRNDGDRTLWDKVEQAAVVLGVAR